jgi:hypothetical protein
MENSSNTKTVDTSEVTQASDYSLSAQKSAEQHYVPQRINPNDDALAELLELLAQVDLKSPLATLNETTISDNNGGRIEL